MVNTFARGDFETTIYGYERNAARLSRCRPTTLTVTLTPKAVVSMILATSFRKGRFLAPPTINWSAVFRASVRSFKVERLVKLYLESAVG